MLAAFRLLPVPLQLKAVKALQQAEVVVYDDLGAQVGVLELCPPDSMLSCQLVHLADPCALNISGITWWLQLAALHRDPAGMAAWHA